MDLLSLKSFGPEKCYEKRQKQRKNDENARSGNRWLKKLS